LSNLGAGANDGIRNHFWGAFQTAVQEWFSQKVEEVLGLGITVWNVLKQGGINVAEVGKMAWEGIKSAIPGVLIQILIEKVVSMIVPAAGTVMLIIEGLQAAWGTVSRILQAFERFMAFLKAVKTGQAGPPFGAALASAGVVVIDFVANWLLKRLRGPASKVAGKIKEIAIKIGNKVKKVLKKLGKKVGKFKDKLFGKKGNKGGKANDKLSNKQKKGKDSKPDQAKNKEDEKQKRVDQAVQVAAGVVNRFGGKRVGKMVLMPILYGIKLRYRLKSLEPIKQGENWAVHGEINPTSTLSTAAKVESEESDSGLANRGYRPKPGERLMTREEWRKQSGGYKPGTRSNNLLGKDKPGNNNLTEWRRKIKKADIGAEKSKFLGEGYVKVAPGKWRSLDGTRQFRVKPDDYLGHHGIGQPLVPNTAHLHLEFLQPANGGKFKVIKNIHIPLE